MTETRDAVGSAQQTRRRALVVPREHGAWGLLLVPLFTGVATGFASAHRVWPLFVFTMAALSLFWLRTPVESLIGTGSLTAHTSGERWTPLGASLFLSSFIERLFDRADVARSKSTVAASRSGNSTCICGPRSSSEARSGDANGGPVGGCNWPHLHCSGCLLHRYRTAR
jgi:hypothetical protein